ncbi:MAG: hypothetical protein HQM14_10300 [SAR324 cluster bacterium]|nr:hypothetical protein [SAR324 cluster bacterium]
MKAIQTIICSLFLVGLGFSVTVHAEERPDWVDGRSSKYPDSQYLLGVGSGDDRRSAKNDTAMAMKRVFEAAIKQEIQEMEKHLQLGSHPGSQTSSGTEKLFQIKKLVKTAGKKLKEAVTFAETWVDPTQVVYQLAILDRQKAAAILKEEIDKEEDIIFEEYSAALEEKMSVAADKLVVARHLYATIQAIMRRDLYNVDYRIAQHTGEGKRFEVLLKLVSPKLQEYLRNDFKIAMEMEGTPQIRKVLVELLTQQGFTVLQGTSASADIVIKGKASFRKIDRPSKNKQFIRWNIEMNLQDVKDGKTIGSVNRTGREAHLSDEEARVRAMRSITKDVLPRLNRQLYGYIFNITT